MQLDAEEGQPNARQHTEPDARREQQNLIEAFPADTIDSRRGTRGQHLGKKEKRKERRTGQGEKDEQLAVVPERAREENVSNGNRILGFKMTWGKLMNIRKHLGVIDRGPGHRCENRDAETGPESRLITSRIEVILVLLSS